MIGGEGELTGAMDWCPTSTSNSRMNGSNFKCLITDIHVKNLFSNKDVTGATMSHKSPLLSRNRFGDQSLRIPTARRDNKHHQINRVRRRSFSEKDET